MQGCALTAKPSYEKIAINTYLDHKQIAELSNHLALLSADNMAGRRFTSAESKDAQNYITSSLIESKVQPFKKQYHHPFKRNSFLSQNKNRELENLK